MCGTAGAKLGVLSVIVLVDGLAANLQTLPCMIHNFSST